MNCFITEIHNKLFFPRKKENMKVKRSTTILNRKFEPAVCRSRKRET